MALTSEQRRNIQTALRIANRKGASPKAKEALLIAGFQESNWQNLNRGDRDSKGVLQLRTGTWGERNARSVERSVSMFLDRGFYGKGGAIKLAKSVGDTTKIAQSVQGSAYPEAYRKHTARARAILKNAPSGGGGSTRGSRGTPGTPDTRTTSSSAAPVSGTFNAQSNGAQLLQALESLKNDEDQQTKQATSMPDAPLTPSLPMAQGFQAPPSAGLPQRDSGVSEAIAALASQADRQANVQTTGGDISTVTGGSAGTPGTPGTRGRGRTRTRGGGGGVQGILQPGGGWGGSEAPAIAAARYAKTLGVKTSSAKRSRMSTASGGVSDHYIGNKDAMARDLSNGSSPTPQMDQLAYDLARTLGNKGYRKGTPLVLTTKKNGYRYQVLYRTQVGGNHNNHVHFGVKKA